MVIGPTPPSGTDDEWDRGHDQESPTNPGILWWLYEVGGVTLYNLRRSNII